ncbi:MAG: hypothetical protein ACRDTT_23825, partial [Pseudonocardiaceae bacterium]
MKWVIHLLIVRWSEFTGAINGTRETYLGYIERTIKPVLGSTSITKLSPRHLETLYAQLRRCKARCDGKPRRRAQDGRRARLRGGDAPAARVHANGRLHGPADPLDHQRRTLGDGAVGVAGVPHCATAQWPRWKPKPDPPSPDEAARLLDEAFWMDEDWGIMIIRG